MDPRNPTTTSVSASATAPPLPQQTQWGLRDCLVMCFFFICGVALIVLIIVGAVRSSNHTLPLQFQVQYVTTSTPFTLTTTTVTAAFNVTFQVHRPNYGALYGPANVSVYYHHQPQPQPHDLEKAVVEYYLSSSSLDSLCPGRSSCDLYDVQSQVSVTVVASSVPVSDDFIAFLMDRDLNQRGEFGITVKISADYWLIHENKDAKLRVTCKDVKMGVPSGVMINQPNQCKVAVHT